MLLLLLLLLLLMMMVLECSWWVAIVPIKKISFGDIPNSNSLMPCLTTWAHSCSAAVLPMRTMSSPKGVQKQSHACSCQGCQATNHTPRNPPEPSGSCIRNLHHHTSEPCGTFRNLPPEPTPAHAATLQNLPEPDSGTYTSTHRNPPEPSGPCFRNLHQPHTGSLRNLPEPASGTYTSTHRNPPEPSGTSLHNLHQRTPEASGTFRNLPPEPSGTCLRNLHQHTPEPSGTFRNLHHTPAPSGTFRNLPPEPAPATRTGAHRSLSGLKTPLAYAVGEKNNLSRKPSIRGLPLATPNPFPSSCHSGAMSV